MWCGAVGPGRATSAFRLMCADPWHARHVLGMLGGGARAHLLQEALDGGRHLPDDQEVINADLHAAAV